MHSVTIPFKTFGQNEPFGSKEDYMQIVQDEYALRYLHMLGIPSTPNNKAVFAKCKPMDECEVHGIWSETHASNAVEAVKIVPPLKNKIRRRGLSENTSDVDQESIHRWYGKPYKICVQPPQTPAKTIEFSWDTNYDDELAAGTASESVGVGGCAEHAKILTSQPSMTTNFADAMERMRQDLFSAGSSPRHKPDDQEHFHLELNVLRSKFIFPFACERPILDYSKRTEVVPWSVDGPLDIKVSNSLRAEIHHPINVEPEDLKKNLNKWIDTDLPVELLMSRKDSGICSEIRGFLKEPEVAQLTGLLVHLAYWVMFGSNRQQGQRRLSNNARQSIFVAVHELWSNFEKYHRNNPVGVNHKLPCLMLVIKHGIERCFEIQYPNVLADAATSQKLIDNINALLMRLFDPDCVYAGFGIFAGTVKARHLRRKLDRMRSMSGHNHIVRLRGQVHRSTQLVQSVLGCGEEAPADSSCDARTRLLLVQSNLGGTAPVCSVVQPPGDNQRKCDLLKAAMHRLSLPKEGGHGRRGLSCGNRGQKGCSQKNTQLRVAGNENAARSRRTALVPVAATS